MLHHIRPQFSYYFISEEFINKLSVIIREDIPKYFQTVFLQGIIEFFTCRLLFPVLFLRFYYPFSRIKQKDKCPRLVVGWIHETEFLLDEDFRHFEKSVIIPVVSASEHSRIIHFFSKALSHTSEQSFPAIVQLNTMLDLTGASCFASWFFAFFLAVI